jgi:2'-5' RNA ligase
MYNQNRGNYGRDGNRGGRRPYQNQGNQFRPKRNPLPEGFSLYYVALICPDAIDESFRGFKDYMFQKYGCKAAGKSPAHITVVPPFRAEDDLEKNLSDFVTTFNFGIVPFDVVLSGYGNFGDRVLYVDVQPNNALVQLEQDCMSDFGNQFPTIIFGMKPPFNPHVTIATRDIPEGKLEEAKLYFETQHPYHQSFEAKDLRLVKLEHGDWKVL